jgi:hypothetical protein
VQSCKFSEIFEKLHLMRSFSDETKHKKYGNTFLNSLWFERFPPAKRDPSVLDTQRVIGRYVDDIAEHQLSRDYGNGDGPCAKQKIDVQQIATCSSNQKFRMGFF